ncbi:zf-CCHC domain-containing [Olea europaea subsp. europaea]|uniref:Zf-CCHC domain-containing, partial n=1 Tax=Olea europaea subsp. europaea TaxID=158383 RepID=A0A8S0RBL7_OLEEU|nr:zf-CCHC domain-containing [Olea europaea subsp. europaea]
MVGSITEYSKETEIESDSNFEKDEAIFDGSIFTCTWDAHRAIVQEAINTTMKVDMMESDKRMISYRSPLLAGTSLSVTSDKGNTPQQAPVNPNMRKIDNSGRFGNRGKTRGVPHNVNSYAKPTREIFYRCQKPGHRSNNCPERKQVNLMEPEAVDEEKDTEVEDE